MLCSLQSRRQQTQLLTGARVEIEQRQCASAHRLIAWRSRGSSGRPRRRWPADCVRSWPIQRVSAIGVDFEEDAEVATDSLPCSREALSTSASRSCTLSVLGIEEDFNRSCLAAGEPEVDSRKARRIFPSRTGTDSSCRRSACGLTTRRFSRRTVSLHNQRATLPLLSKATRRPSAG